MNKILCFGDSITNGARDEYHRNYPLELSRIILEKKNKYYVCLNYGVNGETTSQMANRAYQVLKPHDDAKFILFMGGTNDTKIPIPEDIYQNNIESIIRLSKELEVEICLGLLPPIYGPGLPCYAQEAGNKAIGRYNAIVKALFRKYRLKHCDFSDLPNHLYSDGIHLNHRGYSLIAERWFATLEEHL